MALSILFPPRRLFTKTTVIDGGFVAEPTPVKTKRFCQIIGTPPAGPMTIEISPTEKPSTVDRIESWGGGLNWLRMPMQIGAGIVLCVILRKTLTALEKRNA